MKIFLLDAAGVLSSMVFGVLVLYFGGEYGVDYLMLLFTFLIFGVLATKYGSGLKRRMALYEYERGWENVVANGLVPTLCVIMGFGGGLSGAYIGSLAAVTADKFASEIGVLGDKPRMLFGLKEAKKGQSGAVSILGTFASFDGALVIGIASYLLFFGVFDAWGVLLITCIGFFGSFVDSVFGIFEEGGIGTKASTNIICAITGAILGHLFL
ncbi:MAG: DUF92 domain-containing protein [Candidatus Micrarchaeota archaeon]